MLPNVDPMRGRIRVRGDSAAETLVRERLHAILTAATARTGWVPERVGERHGSAGEGLAGHTDFVPDEEVGSVQPSGSFGCEEPIRMPVATTGASAPSPGRHRGTTEGQPRVRWNPARPGAAALCVVAVVAALLAAGITWWSRPQPSSVDGTAMEPRAAAGGQVVDGSAPPEEDEATQSDSTGRSDPGAATGSVQEGLVVSVIGQVRQPGLVTVVAGARVADAIGAAGGALPDADLSTVNLARLVVDGEQIAVGVPGSSVPGDADPGSSGGLVDLNTATQAELEELPGIGPVLAQRILDFREDNGGFTAVEQLREVSGIGPAVYEDIVDLVTV